MDLIETPHPNMDTRYRATRIQIILLIRGRCLRGWARGLRSLSPPRWTLARPARCTARTALSKTWGSSTSSSFPQSHGLAIYPCPVSLDSSISSIGCSCSTSQ